MSAGIGFLALAVSAHLVGVGLHADEIDDAAETLLAADGKLQRGDGSAEGVGKRFERAIGVGAIAIHAVDDDHARQVDLVAIIPDTLGHNLDTGDAVHDDERRVHHGQHHLGLVHEHIEAGRVEQIDLDLGSGLPHSTKARPVEMDIWRAISSSS